MHCPQCGQEQISGEVRFCKSCGFALNSVKEILNPTKREAKAETNHNTGRGVRQGLALFLLGMLLVPILMLIPGELAGIPNLKTFIFTTVMILGLVRMCYPFAFGAGVSGKKKDSSLESGKYANNALGTSINNATLPSSQSIPITNYATRNLDTAELIQPPSVTEHTTKLLREQDKNS